MLAQAEDADAAVGLVVPFLLIFVAFLLILVPARILGRGGR